MIEMTEQEEINNEVQTRLTVHDEKFNSLMQSLADFKEASQREMAAYKEASQREMAAFKEEMKDFKDEMRDRDNQRHAEIEALRADTNAQIAAIKNSVESIGKHVDNMSITMMVGVGAMVVTVVLSIIFK